jgi:Mrp family chromosome partitioning ATPase
MDIARYIRILRRRWGLFAVFAVVGMLGGWAMAARPDTGDDTSGKTVYVATHTLSVTSPLSNIQPTLEPDQIALQINGGAIPARVAERQGGEVVDYNRRAVATSNTTLRQIYLAARADTASGAEELADVFAEETAEWVGEYQAGRAEAERSIREAQIEQLDIELYTLTGEGSRIQRRKTNIETRIASLESEINALDPDPTKNTPSIWNAGKGQPVTKAVADDYFKTASQAKVGRRSAQTATTIVASSTPQKPTDSSVPPPLGALAGGGLGIALASMLVFGWAALDPRLFTKEQAEAAFGFPVIAEIPALSRRQRKETAVLSREAPLSRFAEAYRGLASAMLYLERTASAPKGQSPNGSANGNGNGHAHGAEPSPQHDEGERERRAVTVMITSPSPNEGKTTTAANLAAVLAEGGRDVLAVSCDFRRPRLHLYLGCEHEPRTVLGTEIPQVFLVSSVVRSNEAHSPGEVVAEQRRVITAARSRFDYIVLDTAPMLTTSDASELLPVTDMVVTVCRAGRTNRESADRTAEMLERFDAPVVGAVLVGSTEGVIPRYYYYYSENAPLGNEVVDASSPNPLTELRKRPGDTPFRFGDEEISDQPGGDHPQSRV